jgi:hypothetical protein
MPARSVRSRSATSRVHVVATTRWLPGMFVPFPIQTRQQRVFHVIAGISHAKTPPDQMGDALGGPDGRVKAVGERPLLEQFAQARQLFGRQFRARASRFRTAAQPRISTRTVPARPSLHRLNGNAQGMGDHCGGLAALQPGDGGEPPLFQFSCVSALVTQVPRHLPFLLARTTPLALVICLEKSGCGPDD